MAYKLALTFLLFVFLFPGTFIAMDLKDSAEGHSGQRAVHNERSHQRAIWAIEKAVEMAERQCRGIGVNWRDLALDRTVSFRYTMNRLLQGLPLKFRHQNYIKLGEQIPMLPVLNPNYYTGVNRILCIGFYSLLEGERRRTARKLSKFILDWSTELNRSADVTQPDYRMVKGAR